MPAPTKGYRWTYTSEPVNRRLAGIIYWRSAGLQNDVVRTVQSSQAFVREVPASEAAPVNAQIPTFNNRMSSVEETSSDTPKAAALPFTEEPDWTANPAVCSPPTR